ncbi:MAG: hypothetical protein IPP50_00395 [Piscinibacter sp.]|nr:hypothetical protein [Piscinibacter sp.]
MGAASATSSSTIRMRRRRQRVLVGREQDRCAAGRASLIAFERAGEIEVTVWVQTPRTGGTHRH